MISYKLLRKELKRYPGFIKEAIKQSNYKEAYEYKIEMDIIEWILTDED